jgi:hypothetical protein
MSTPEVPRTQEQHQGERGHGKDLERDYVHAGAKRNEGGHARANISDGGRSGDGTAVDTEVLKLLADKGAGAVLPERELQLRMDATPKARREEQAGRIGA